MLTLSKHWPKRFGEQAPEKTHPNPDQNVPGKARTSHSLDELPGILEPNHNTDPPAKDPAENKGHDHQNSPRGEKAEKDSSPDHQGTQDNHLKPQKPVPNPTRDGSPKKGGGGWMGLFAKEKKNKSKKATTSETIYITNYEDLPKEFQKMVKNAKISPTLAKDNLRQLLIILSFCSKKHLKLKLSDGSIVPSEEPFSDQEVEDMCRKMNDKVFKITKYSPQSNDYHPSSSSQSSSNPPSSSPPPPSLPEEPPIEIAKDSLIWQTQGPKIPSDLSSHGEKLVLKNTGVSPKKKYKITQEAGQGGFGKVYEAKGPESSRIAIKKVAHVEKKDIRSNFAEIGLLASANHPNIVSFRDAYQLDDELWIMMEYMEGGTLTQATEGCSFKETHISYVAREILKGIGYLHRNNLLHRDLKSGNVMMSITGQIKLIDFGLCCSVFSGARRKMAGSPYWMPPEMIQRRPYGFPIDIWSMAICLLEMANKSPPNNQPKLSAMFRIATEGVVKPFDSPESWSVDMHNFFSLCLKFDPVQRASAFELLEHPFVNKADECLDMQTILKAVFLHTALRMLEV